MKKRFAAFFMSAALVLGAFFSVPAPANAGPACAYFGICGYMYHGNDDGYDPAIIITCNWNTKAQNWLYENTGSDRFCTDMDGFYVRPGEELWCWNSAGIGYWAKRADETGWYKMTDDEKYKNCTLRVD